MSNIQEIKARKGRVIAIVTEGDEKVKNLADEYIELPQTLECLEPLLATIPLQLLASTLPFARVRTLTSHATWLSQSPWNKHKTIKVWVQRKKFVTLYPI